jgi:hypothetical protein
MLAAKNSRKRIEARAGSGDKGRDDGRRGMDNELVHG